jgi:hypothetical protein
MAEETTISRRKLIKRAGIGAAAVWSVPFLASTASADVGIETLRQRCTNGDGSPFCTVCQTGNGCGSKNGKACFCYVGAKAGIGSGCCECAGNIFCDQSPPCSSNSNCPRGWKCTFNCCGRTCVPPCGQGIAAGSGSGRTSAAV